MLITWPQSSVSVEVGQSVTVSFVTGQDYELMRDISTSDSSVATISTTGSGFSGVATIVGVSAGTATTVPGGSDTQNTPLTITVTAPAPVEDDKFLNKRGLTHFWENIDDIKQDKLTAGTNITIAADNTISASQPTVNDATLTIQRNGTNVQTFTANQSTNATANITVPTDNNELTNGAGYITSSGTAAKANQLTTARTIAISGGVTGTATSFNGTSNISIPVTYVRDAYTIWGGKDIVTDISPDDAGCIDEFGHNKLAFLPAECIEVKYSTDGGTTWTDYGLTDAQKVAMVTTTGPGVYAGKSATITADNIANMRGRVRIACGTMAKSLKIYTALKKILINFSTNGATNAKIKIRRRTIANYLSGTETWEDLGTHNIGGWSGWNSYAYNGTYFGGNMTNQTTQPGQIEFEFWSETFNSSTSRCSLIDIRFIGTTNWTTPSELSRAGHLYTMDVSRNATFPANVNVTGSLGHGSYTYTLPNKNGTVAMTSDIPSVPTVNNGQLTIQKNGTTVNTFTANASSNVTANITVPTATSGLANDGADGTSAYVEADDLASVATSGSYNDLSNKPTIPAAQVNSDWNASSGVAQILNKPTLATVATSGSYNDLTDKPTIADENYLITVTSFSGSGGTYGFVADRTYAEIEAAYQAGKHLIICADIYRVSDSGQSPTAHEYLYAELSSVEDSGGSDGPTFAFIATTASGSGRSITIWSHNFYVYGYTNNPYNTYSVNNASITVTDIISNSQNPVSSSAVYTALAAKANTSSLATVATSGSYNDLSNKPTIPVAGTITSGSTGYATGGDVYTAIGNVETILQTLNNGGGAQ